MNKESNSYTLIYIIVLVVVVGAALAATSMALADRQQANVDADKMRQILASVHVAAGDDVAKQYKELITDSYVINSKGEKVAGNNAFGIDIAEESKKADNERLLPVYVCNLPERGTKYILPVYGAGLWGPIWGYVAVDSNGRDIYGAYFAHQGETPGLGAEIEKPDFSDQFDGKPLWHGDKFEPVQVVKKGQKPVGDAASVDGISGGTITSKGVSAMLANCLKPYEAFLNNLNEKK